MQRLLPVTEETKSYLDVLQWFMVAVCVNAVIRVWSRQRGLGSGYSWPYVSMSAEGSGVFLHNLHFPKRIINPATANRHRPTRFNPGNTRRIMPTNMDMPRHWLRRRAWAVTIATTMQTLTTIAKRATRNPIISCYYITCIEKK